MGRSPRRAGTGVAPTGNLAGRRRTADPDPDRWAPAWSGRWSCTRRRDSVPSGETGQLGQMPRAHSQSVRTWQSRASTSSSHCSGPMVTQATSQVSVEALGEAGSVPGSPAEPSDPLEPGVDSPSEPGKVSLPPVHHNTLRRQDGFSSQISPPRDSQGIWLDTLQASSGQTI